jgi:hypothetical protein
VAKQLFDLPLSASMRAETKQLLAAATELFAESNGDANALLDLALSAAAPVTATPRQRPTAATGSTAFVAQALFSNIETVNKAVGLCGPHSGASAAKNLADHETVVGVAKRLLAAAQATTEAAFLHDGGPPTKPGVGDGEPPAAGMIGIVAKLQAGIWAQHQQARTPETARLLSRYTAMLLK